MVMPFIGRAARASMPILASYGRKMGWSGERIIAEARRQGLGYRRTDMLSDVRAYLGRERLRPAALGVPKKYHPSTSHFAKSDFAIKRKYQVAIEFRGRNVVTGEPMTHTVYMEYDQLPTVGEMELEALERWGDEYRKRIDMDIDNYRFTGGYYRA